MNSFEDYPMIDEPFGFQQYILGEFTIPSGQNGLKTDKATPVYNGGTQITRHDLNRLGLLATTGAYLDRIGYPYGQELTQVSGDRVPSVIYHKGSIITTIVGNEVREWVSLQDNNMSMPPKDGYIDSDDQTYGWAPVYKIKNANFYPDYSRRELVISRKAVKGTSSIAVNLSAPGWVLVQRKIDGWSKLSPETLLEFDCEVHINLASVDYAIADDDRITIRAYEGEIASRLLPMPQSFTISINMTSYYSSMTVEVYRYAFEDEEA